MYKDDRWLRETERYRAEISNLALMTNELREAFECFPGLLNFVPSPAGSIRHRSLIYANTTFTTAVELFGSIQMLWGQAQFMAASHCTRLIFELWGSLIYAEIKILKKLHEPDGVDVAENRLNKLLLGSKTDQILPAGIEGRFPVINVMDFIRAGEEKSPGFEARYNLFCDISHPSYVHTYFNWFRFSGSWANPHYAEAVHRILSEVTSSTSMSISGISSEVGLIYKLCLPDLLAEIEKRTTPA